MSSSESEFSSSLSSNSSYLSAYEASEDLELEVQAEELYDDSLEPVANEQEVTEYLEEVAIVEDGALA